MRTDSSLALRFASSLDRLAGTDALVVAATSGGADSVAAARLLAETGRPFLVAHFDHRLRENSEADAAFVEELSATLGAPFMRTSVDVAAVAREKGWNLEDAARRLRYAFLHRVLRGAGRPGVILVSHTLDDQAETFLLQLMRGAAYPSGMAARRGAVVRPLLEVRREELRAYLRSEAQTWREDASNLDVTRNRAWLRHEVLPSLESRYRGVTVRLARTAAELAGAKEALEELASARFGSWPLATKAMAAAPAALRRTAIASALRGVSVPPSAELVDALESAVLHSAALGSRAAPWQRDVGRNVRASVAYGQVALATVPADAGNDPGARAVTTAADLPAGVDPAVLEGRPALVLRHRQPGDRIRLAGGSKLVSDLLIDRKVPRAERDTLAVLADGAEVLWVEGVAAAVNCVHDDATADTRFMRLALEEARLGAAEGEVPVGAVVVIDGEVVAAAHNLTEASGDPTAHAELLALRAAALAAGDWRLHDATLYVTLEPCAMCLGAALQAQLGRLVFGATNVRDGALGGVVDLAAARWKRVPEVVGGVEAAAASRLLSETFSARRVAPRAARGEAAVPAADDALRDGTS